VKHGLLTVTLKATVEGPHQFRLPRCAHPVDPGWRRGDAGVQPGGSTPRLSFKAGHVYTVEFEKSAA
jgi:hypothetical protein